MRRYRKIPSDVIVKWRIARRNGAPLRQICEQADVTVQYASKVCLGHARPSAGGPITPRRQRCLTSDEKAVVQQAVRAGIKFYGRGPSSDTLAKVVSHDPGAAAKEAARYQNWITRLLSYIGPGAPGACRPWTGGVSRYQTKAGITLERPRFVHDGFTTTNPRNWYFDFKNGRPGKPLAKDERLKQTCGNLVCMNPAHQQVVQLKTKKERNATAAQ